MTQPTEVTHVAPAMLVDGTRVRRLMMLVPAVGLLAVALAFATGPAYGLLAAGFLLGWTRLASP